MAHKLYTVLALDLEGMLIFNAANQFPRPGLLGLLAFCRARFSRIVFFTSVPYHCIRRIVDHLVMSAHAPVWLREDVECVEWTGRFKDLSFVHEVDASQLVPIDDHEGSIHQDQKDQWLQIEEFVSPYPERDVELGRTSHLSRNLGDLRTME